MPGGRVKVGSYGPKRSNKPQPAKPNANKPKKKK